MAIKIQSLPTVSQQAGAPVLDQSQARASDFGLSNMAGAAADIAKGVMIKEQQKADLSASQAWTNGEDAWWNEAVNSETGYFNTSKGERVYEDGETLVNNYRAYLKEKQQSLPARYHESFRLFADRQLRQRENQIQKYQAAEIQQYNQNQHNSLLKNSLTNVANNFGDNELVESELDKGVSNIQAWGISQGLPPETIQEQMNSFMSGGRESVVTQMLGRNDFRGAKQYLKTYKNQIDPNKRAQLKKTADAYEEQYRAKIEREQRKIRAEQQEVLMANLADRYYAGNLTEADISNAFNNGKGLLSGSQYVRFKGLLNTQRKKQAKADESHNYVATSIEIGRPLDPKDKTDKKAVDTYFTEQSKIWNPDEFDKKTFNLIQSTGIVPQTIISSTRARLRSKNADDVYQAADLLDKIRQVNPKLLQDFDSDDRAYAQQVMFNSKTGQSPTAAVEMATKNVFNTTPQEKAAFTQIAKDAEKNKNVSALKGFVDDDLDPFITTSQPTANPVMQAQFNTKVSDYITKTGGDVEMAQKLAWDDLKNVWGGSQLGAGGKKSPELMAYSPESVYGNGVGKSDWIVDQFDQEVRSKDKNAFITINNEVMRSERPVYPVMTRDELGRVIPKMDKNNRVMVWRPDVKDMYKSELNRRVKSAEKERKRKLTDEEIQGIEYGLPETGGTRGY